MTTVSPFSAGASSLITNSANCVRRFSKLSSTSSSVTSRSYLVTSKSLYCPSLTSGFNETSTSSSQSLPGSHEISLIEGCPTTSSSTSSNASAYAVGKMSFNVSSYNDSSTYI